VIEVILAFPSFRYSAADLMFRESIVGHPKRKERHHPAPPSAAARVEEHAVLDDGTVDRILELRLGTEDGDPVAGIRNAIVAAGAFWTALGLVLIYLI
jgi:hypothetical protein